MRILATGVLLALFLLIAIAARAAAETEPPERQFIALMNEYRGQNGLPPVLMDPRLQESSEWKSEDMANNNYFSHTDSEGKDPFFRMRQFGYTHNTYLAENIAAGYETPQQTLDGWKNSPGHNAAMLDPVYKVAGVGYHQKQGTTFTNYWTLHLGGFDLPMDADGDAWDDKLEIYLGNAVSCSVPPDVNDDGFYDLSDIIAFGPHFNKPAGSTPVSMRFDYNASGFVSLADIVKTGPYFNTRFC